MWNTIKTEEDIKVFMEQIVFFHDSCIKEMSYVSGAYMNKDCSMYPINDCRNLKMIIYRQFEDFPAIELEFMGIRYLKLYPATDNYTCEILGAALFFKDGLIYWCDDDFITPDNMNDYQRTIVCAESLRWRSIGKFFGNDPFYVPKL